jgi:hypothetical protein
MTDDRSFPEAADGRPTTEEQAILFSVGLDPDTARFVADQLERQGYVLGREQDILERAIDRMGWPEIHAYQHELRRGQDIYEDAGGFFMRAIRRLFGLPSPYDEVTTYQDAARALVARAKAEKETTR